VVSGNDQDLIGIRECSRKAVRVREVSNLDLDALCAEFGCLASVAHADGDLIGRNTIKQVLNHSSAELARCTRDNSYDQTFPVETKSCYH
jgi:hypothetical protein